MSDNKDLQVVASPHPFSSDRIETWVQAGRTLQSILEELQPNPELRQFAHVFIEDQLIKPEFWHVVRPKVGQRVTVRVVPGNRTVRKAILTVVLLVITYFVPALAPYTMAAIAGIWAYKLVPKPHIPDGGDIEAPRGFGLGGTRNQMHPYGAIPLILGRHYLVPPYGARPYSELIGDDQYLRILFLLGYGPLQIEDLRIGQTPIDEFEFADSPQVRNGLITDPPTTLYPGVVIEEPLSITLREEDSWVVRTSATDADEISVDITFPKGLVRFDDGGKRLVHSVQIEAQYRLSGDSTWQDLAPHLDVPERFIPARVWAAEEHRLTISKVTGEPALHTWDDTPPPNTFTVAKVTSEFSQWGDYIGFFVTDMRDPEITQFGAGHHAPTRVGSNIRIAPGRMPMPAFTVSEKTTSAVRRSVTFKVAKGQYDVRLRRITEHTDDDRHVEEVAWSALRTFRDEEPIRAAGSGVHPAGYLPPMAKVAMRIRASERLNGVVDEFNCIATSVCPDWNAATQTWVTRPTSNPASLYRWVLQGPFNRSPVPDSMIDLEELQAWHAECAANGIEFNAVIDAARPRVEILTAIATVGRAVRTRRDGKHSVIRDRVHTTPVQVFTPRNSRNFSAARAFPEVLHALKVRFIDSASGWQRGERIVYDDGYALSPGTDVWGGPALAATKFETIDLYGVTDSDQAWKDGRYHLAQLRLRPEVYTFEADVEHLVCTRGDLIEMQHDVPMIGVRSARIKSVDTVEGTTEIVIDEFVPLTDEYAFGVRVRRSDGTFVEAAVLYPGEDEDTDTLHLASLIEVAPGDLVMYGQAGLETVKLIVHSIDINEDLSAKITALDYAPEIHTAPTAPIPPYDPQMSDVADVGQRPPPPPKILSVISDGTVLIPLGNGTLQSRILISLSAGEGTVATERFRTQHRPSGSSKWVASPDALLPISEISITPVEDLEEYEIRVQAVSHNGAASEWVTLQHVVIGKTGRPATVSNFQMQALAGIARLRWDLHPDADVRVGGQIEIRYTSRLLNADWSEAVPIGGSVPGNATSTEVPLLAGTYFAKAVDSGGRTSATAARVISSVANVEHLNVVEVLREDPDFTGERTNLHTLYGGLALVGEGGVDSGPEGEIIHVGGVMAEGLYEFSQEVDLGEPFVCRLMGRLEAMTFLVDDWVDNYGCSLEDGGLDVCGPVDSDSDDAGAELEVRIDDGDWTPFYLGDFVGRKFAWRARFHSENPSVNILVREIEAEVDMPDRVEGEDDVHVNGVLHVAFDPPFRKIPAMAVTIDDAQQGDYYTVTNKTTHGATITIFDRVDLLAERQIDWIAKAYGRALNGG